jgi:hypothetical protein
VGTVQWHRISDESGYAQTCPNLSSLLMIIGKRVADIDQVLPVVKCYILSVSLALSQ